MTPGTPSFLSALGLHMLPNGWTPYDNAYISSKFMKDYAQAPYGGILVAW